MGKRPFASQLFWVVPFLVFVFSLVVWLLIRGAKGNEIAGPLSLLVACLSLLVALLGQAYTRHKDRADEPKAAAAIGRKVLPRWKKRLLAGVCAAVVGTGAAVLYWSVIRKPDIPVTDLATVTNGQALQSGRQAEIRVPGSPPQRRYLAFTPVLHNPRVVGDCVGSASLDVSLVRDGRESVAVVDHRQGKEIRLDLDGTTREATVRITVQMADPVCGVDLRLAEAVLYN